MCLSPSLNDLVVLPSSQMLHNYPFAPSGLHRGLLAATHVHSLSLFLTVLELVWKRAHTETWRFWENRRPPDHPLPRLCERRDHVFRCLERRHLRVERDQPDKDSARSSWGEDGSFLNFFFSYPKRLFNFYNNKTVKPDQV